MSDKDDTRSQSREDRLAEQLRANLRRRKTALRKARVTKSPAAQASDAQIPEKDAPEP